MRAVFVIIALGCLSTCKDPVDVAAKARIFSPEDPPQALAAASEKLPPQDAASDSRVARRILGMSAAEATERIGPHRFTANVTWEWMAQGKPLRLKESRELLSGPGGVSGDFHARQWNDRELGFEVVRVKGAVFARSTYGRDGEGAFRQRLRDRGMAERIRNETYRALGDFDSLFRGRLKLAVTEQGTANINGRLAWKYAVTLGDEKPGEPSSLPPVAVPKSGLDETTQRRLAFAQARAPRTLQGELFVDAETSVVLKARLDGRLAVVTDGGAPAELRLVLESALVDIGKVPGFAPPKDFLPDEDKPQGIAAATARFGYDRRADAGVSGPALDPSDDSE